MRVAFGFGVLGLSFCLGFWAKPACTLPPASGQTLELRAVWVSINLFHTPHTHTRIPLSHTHAHTHTHTHTDTHALAHARAHTHTDPYTYTRSRTRTRSLSLTHTHTTPGHPLELRIGRGQYRALMSVSNRLVSYKVGALASSYLCLQGRRTS